MDVAERPQQDDAEEHEAEAEQNYGVFSHNMDELTELGIAVADIKKMKDAGYHTVESIWQTPTRELIQVRGMSEAKVAKMKEAAQKTCHTGFTTAKEKLLQRASLVKITTGCRDVDDILEGGMESGSITELYGEYRTGKTQICHTLAVTCQMPLANGGAEGKAMYIDTENTFRPQRLQQIAEKFGLDAENVLDNVAYAQAHTCEAQDDLIKVAAGMMSESRFAIIIVDSATALFRTEFTGRGELAPRQNQLGRFLRNLGRLASQFGVAVVVTNQVVVSDMGGGSAMFAGPSVKAIGGNIMAHSTTTRLYLRKGKKDSRVMKIMSSPCLGEKEATFTVTADGVGDFVDG